MPMLDVTDELALRAASMRYAAGVDRRDAELFVSAFTPTGRLQVYRPHRDDPVLVLTGHAELVDITRRVTAYTATYHLVGNTLYDTAHDPTTGEVYCEAHHLDADDGTDKIMYIRYLDEYGRGAEGEWCIADRAVHVDWTEIRTVERP